METPVEEKVSDRLHYHNLKIAQTKFQNTSKSPQQITEAGVSFRKSLIYRELHFSPGGLRF